MKKLLSSFMFILCAVVAVAQQNDKKLYSIAFYNLENLFDTIHDSDKNDYDFLPDGSYKWTGQRYQAKLKNMS